MRRLYWTGQLRLMKPGEAAIALAEGDVETAAAKAREGLAAMDKARFGASEADRESLEQILAEAKELAPRGVGSPSQPTGNDLRDGSHLQG